MKTPRSSQDVTERLDAVYATEDSRLDTTIRRLQARSLARDSRRSNSEYGSGLPKDSVASASQIITIDRDFLLERAGRIRGHVLNDLDRGLRLVLGL